MMYQPYYYSFAEPSPHFAVVTAEFLTVFLETCGYKMSHYYGVQFRKIVQLLVDEYIDKIEKVRTVVVARLKIHQCFMFVLLFQITPDDFRGPISRLKLYVVENDVLRRGFREPAELHCVDDWL